MEVIMDSENSLERKPRHRLIFTIILIVLVGVIINHFFKSKSTYQTERLPLPKEPLVMTVPVATPEPKTAPPQIVKTVQFKSSVIHHSLAQAGRAAGLPHKMLAQLNSMFANTAITHQLHPGAHLYVLYHEYFVNNHKDHPGNIIAAEIVNGKQHYSLVRFTTPAHRTGYYTPTGASTQPGFLRAPLHYTRISSKFSYHRMDPVVHRVHPHLGVDLTAPKGTPIKAIGDGMIVFNKKFGGYGNAIMIRYNGTYKTLYGHLEKFAKNIHPFERVHRGQIVGYVGQTGWATGPHLHYEVLKNNKPVNPLTVQMPHMASIPEKYRRLFYNESDKRLSELRLFIDATKPSSPKPAKKKA